VRAAAVARLRQLPRVAFAVPRRARGPLLVGLVLALTLLSAYRFWFRDSSFVAVRHVTVTGLTTSDAPRIRTALTAAAHEMSTLHVQQAALDAAVAGFPVVKGVVAEPAFPHGLKIRVVEERPVALLAVGGERLLLAPDGGVLRGVATGHPLALIRSRGAVPQDTLTERAPLSALRVVAAAPALLAARISSVGQASGQGLVVKLRSGPEVIFGGAGRVAAKWAAAAAVLADPSSRGASYVDVRLPGRPVAGGLAASTLAPITATGNDASTQSNAQVAPAGAAGATGPQGALAQPSTQAYNPQP
jgi:cell division protein FtsQ